jgi:conjugative transposon TraN protein
MRLWAPRKPIDMKRVFFYLIILISCTAGAQNNPRTVYLNPGFTMHFISPEPIGYVDISSKSMEGDLPLKNVLRLKFRDTARYFNDAIVTITGEKFIAQYRVVPGKECFVPQINIIPEDCFPLDISGVGLSQNQLRSLALDLFSRKAEKHLEKVSAFGIQGKLNHIYSAGDYLFLDISYHNKTNLKYDIEGLLFSVEDRKVTKASTVQSVALKPEFTLFNVPMFARYYRNIFVLRKLSFPGNKVLRVTLGEKQISGRLITLNISYKDVLSADILPNGDEAIDEVDTAETWKSQLGSLRAGRRDILDSPENH